jgi:hypothetical protein
VALAVDASFDPELNSAVAEPALGDVQGEALVVGPQAEKVTVPVGDPPALVPVTVAVSMSVLPRGMLELVKVDVSVGVVGWVEEPVTSRHSVLVSLSLTAL